MTLKPSADIVVLLNRSLTNHFDKISVGLEVVLQGMDGELLLPLCQAQHDHVQNSLQIR